MRLIRATQHDFDGIIAFYDDVTTHTPDMALYARWSKGKHPTEESIRTYIEEGNMYLYREDDGIVGAMAVTMYQGEEYHAIEWSQQVGDDEVAVIHILAVSPDRQVKGIGSKMILEAIHLAQANGMKTVRLDSLASTSLPTESTSASASGSVDNNISMLRIPAGQTFISLKFNNSVVWIK